MVGRHRPAAHHLAWCFERERVDNSVRVVHLQTFGGLSLVSKLLSASLLPFMTGQGDPLLAAAVASPKVLHLQHSFSRILTELVVNYGVEFSSVLVPERTLLPLSCMAFGKTCKFANQIATL